MHVPREARRRPRGIVALGIFFILGAAIAFTAALSLAFPGSPLDSMWELNPRARTAFGRLGVWAIALMAVVAIACAASALGLWRGARWGYGLALALFTVHLVADVVNTVLGLEPRAIVGVPIVGGLIAYLLTRPVRSFFAASRP